MRVKEHYLDQQARNSLPFWEDAEIIMGSVERDFRQCVQQLARRMTYAQIIAIVDEELPE